MTASVKTGLLIIWGLAITSPLLISLLISQTVLAANQQVMGVGAYPSTRFTGDRRTQLVDKLKDLNVGITRQEFNYQNIGGAAGSNFGPDNDSLTLLRDRGIEVLGLLSYSAKPSVADWKSFVKNTALQFKGRVVAWEILNEPNDGKSVHSLTPTEYKEYLQASFEAIKAADPSALVVTGAVVGDFNDWIQEFFVAGGGNFADGIGFHPYKGTNPTERPELNEFGVEDIVGHTRQLIAAINRHVSGKPIWVTEYGWQSGVVSDEPQANYLTRELLLLRSLPEVARIITYNAVDDNSGSWGILNGDLNRKTAADRLSEAMTNLATTSAEPIYPMGRETIASFDVDIEGFATDRTNGDLTLSHSSDGYQGGALKVDYRFDAAAASVIAKRPTALPGSPSGLGLWVYGDNARNIIRARITDAGGETFQYAVGTVPAGWHFYRLDLHNDKNRFAFGGDGTINFPINFDSVIVDRHPGGDGAGTVRFDEIVTIPDQINLYAVKFGGSVAYWHATGSTTVQICGNDVTAVTTVRYLSVDPSCVAWNSSNKLPAAAATSVSVKPTTKQSCKVVKKKRLCTTVVVKPKAAPAKKAPVKKAVKKSTKKIVPRSAAAKKK